jgi:hypothetical protein
MASCTVALPCILTQAHVSFSDLASLRTTISSVAAMKCYLRSKAGFAGPAKIYCRPPLLLVASLGSSQCKGLLLVQQGDQAEHKAHFRVAHLRVRDHRRLVIKIINYLFCFKSNTQYPLCLRLS